MINPPFKLIAFLLSMLAVSSVLSADQESYGKPAQRPVSWCLSGPLFELKTGYFSFSDPALRKIYDKGGWDVQLCASYPVWDMTREWTLHVYGAVEYVRLSGETLNGDSTSLELLPIHIGLKPLYEIQTNLHYYVATGPRYFHIHQHNDSPHVSQNRSKNGLGFFINTGFNYALCELFVIDIFGEYSHAKVHFDSDKPYVYTKDTQIGGFTFGIGLGYRF